MLLINKGRAVLDPADIFELLFYLFLKFLGRSGTKNPSSPSSPKNKSANEFLPPLAYALDFGGGAIGFAGFFLAAVVLAIMFKNGCNFKY